MQLGFTAPGLLTPVTQLGDSGRVQTLSAFTLLPLKLYTDLLSLLCVCVWCLCTCLCLCGYIVYI